MARKSQALLNAEAQIELLKSQLALRDAEIETLNTRLLKGHEMVRGLHTALASAEAKLAAQQKPQQQARPNRAEFMAHAALMKQRMDQMKQRVAETGKTVAYSDMFKD